MNIHVIPDIEKNKHIESIDCVCEPDARVDAQTGTMVWVHHILDIEDLFKDFINLGR